MVMRLHVNLQVVAEINKERQQGLHTVHCCSRRKHPGEEHNLTLQPDMIK